MSNICHVIINIMLLIRCLTNCTLQWVPVFKKYIFKNFIIFENGLKCFTMCRIHKFLSYNTFSHFHYPRAYLSHRGTFPRTTLQKNITLKIFTWQTVYSESFLNIVNIFLLLLINCIRVYHSIICHRFGTNTRLHTHTHSPFQSTLTYG